LRIAPGRGHYRFAAALLLFSALLWGCVWLAARDRLDGSLPLLLGAVATLGFGCYILLAERTHEFDREQGTYRRRSLLGRRATVPLARIRAVQLLTEVPRQTKESPDRTRHYAAFQINLVLFDAKRPRRFLLEDSDRDSTVRIARALSDFLKVPLFRNALSPRQ
jgi:hypothetical protein